MKVPSITRHPEDESIDDFAVVVKRRKAPRIDSAKIFRRHWNKSRYWCVYVDVDDITTVFGLFDPSPRAKRGFSRSPMN